jgi:hypothetical protein
VIIVDNKEFWFHEMTSQSFIQVGIDEALETFSFCWHKKTASAAVFGKG